MSDKIARLGIERDNDKMYYIKNGDVWAVPRKQKGQPKGKAQKVASTGLEMDYSRYIYYLDGDGDVARKERALGGGGRAAKPRKAAAPSKATAPSTSKATAPSKPSRGRGKPAPSAPTRKPHEMVWTGKGKKSETQLDREIEECLAQAKAKYGPVGDEDEDEDEDSTAASLKRRKTRR